MLDIESLTVDAHLSTFIEGLTGIRQVSISTMRDEKSQPWGILLPQPAEHQVSGINVSIDLLTD